MDIRALDLNLLVALDALLEARSVTRAAEAIGLSQPAMSAALARLRGVFDDPLLVRAGAAMAATPLALSLAEPVRRVLDLVKGEILQRSSFEPVRSERVFTVITPDVGEVHFLPGLLALFAQQAPLARLRTLARPPQAAAESLASGEADLALGYFPDLQRAGFYQQKLFDNPHVCLLRQGHPDIGVTLSLGAYLAARHAVVRPDGREHVFEQFMQHEGLQRRIGLELSHYMSLLPVLAASDLIATVPQDLAEVCVRYAPLRIVAVPLAAPVIAVHQFWHQRFHKDAANVWLRQLIAQRFAGRD